MKSVKMFFGMMLCLVVLAGQAQATVLDFEKVTSLSQYGIDNGVVFTGWDGILQGELGHNLQDTSFSIPATASIAFSPLSAYLVSFDFKSTTYGDGKISVSIAGKDYDLTGDSKFLASDYNLANVLLSSVTFKLDSTLGAAMLRLDNFSYTPTPLPGAAILLGSGLLGLIGLRRREII